MKIGLIKEGKFPVDRRVAFTPGQLAEMQRRYAGKLTFVVESSPVRAFTDDEYREKGVPVVTDLEDCDILMGIKEVPIPQLLDEKTYFFFSHTIKKQAYNRPLLLAIMEKKITLVDYEVLRNLGERVVAFGRWAGIVGGYNGLWTYGKKTGLFDLKRAKDCYDLEVLLQEVKKIQLPPIKMVITGDGRVGKGVQEILLATGIKEVSPKELLNKYYDEPVFALLGMEDYNRRKTDGGYDKEEFCSEPELYESHFLKYTEVCDILFAAAYWDPKAPRLFDAQESAKEEFNLSVIADITCDIEGSIPTTLKASTIADPVYDVDREKMEVIPPFGSQHSLSVMAIDNLPCELPRDASEEFGADEFCSLEENNPIIEEATIVKEGQLTDKFSYLEDFVKELK